MPIMRALWLALRAAIVAACLACLTAGCEPLDEPPTPVPAIELESTTGPDGEPILRQIDNTN